jgi:hypothetical protein
VAGKAALSKAQARINNVNTGGGNIASELQAWGANQIQLALALLKNQPPRVRVMY